jgi:hypothetical protein
MHSVNAYSCLIARIVCFSALVFFIAIPNMFVYANTITNSVDTVPDNPTRLMASAGDGSVDLNWFVPVNRGGFLITSIWW